MLVALSFSPQGSCKLGEGGLYFEVVSWFGFLSLTFFVSFDLALFTDLPS